MFQQPVSEVGELRGLVGEPSELVRRKVLDRLDKHSRDFLAQSPFALIGTAGDDGSCDVSPRGDGPGFAWVYDDRTVILPERAGNKRIDTLRNIVLNPNVGTLFLVPGRTETLRINGRATLYRDPMLLERLAVKGKPPEIALVVEAQEVYFQCAKALLRSKLWDTASWLDPASFATLGQMLYDQIKPADLTVAELDARLAVSNARLY